MIKVEIAATEDKLQKHQPKSDIDMKLAAELESIMAAWRLHLLSTKIK